MPRFLALAIVLPVLLLAGSSVAQGATYTQHVCKLPDGTPTIADGFVGYTLGTSAIWGDSCLAGGPLFAKVPGTSTSRTFAGLTYHAPASTSIVAARVTRDTSDIGQPGNATYTFVDTSDECRPSTCPSGISGGTYSWTGTTDFIDFLVQCPASGCTAPGPHPTINLRRLEIDLNDAAVPQIVGPPSAGLFDQTRSLHGTEAVSFTATDAGGGIASASILVDGVERDRRVLDANNGACQRPYVFSVPCKQSVAAAYSLDTTTLADGRHDVTLQVRDATEVNQATYGPIAITVDNTPPLPPAIGTSVGIDVSALTTAIAAATRPNGARADVLARLSGAGGARTLRFGSATVLRGRLQDHQGKAIANARLDVLASVRRPGAKRALIGHVTTSASGTYSFRLPAGASRDVRIAYRAHAGDTDYATTQRVVVLVQAGVRLRRSAARLRNGRTLTLTADVLGPQVRRRSATVAFQVKVGNRWRTFAASSIGSRRRAAIRHRFRYTKAATTYRFRARTIRTASFPYIAGVSNVTSVVVAP